MRLVSVVVAVYAASMCGRFALGIPKVRLEEVFDISLPGEYSPRYNIAPGGGVLTIAAPEGEMRPAFLRWGLIPHWWARDASVGQSLVNARSETVFEKPAFEDAIRTSRCLVPAEAFYEWKKTDGRRQPYAIALSDADVFAMAGVASSWEDHVTGETVDSFAILTCASNRLVAPIHGRMPVILPPEAWAAWLDPAVADPDKLAPLLEAFPSGNMRVWPVGKAVNSVVNDSRDLLERVDIMRQGRLF